MFVCFLLFSAFVSLYPYLLNPGCFASTACTASNIRICSGQGSSGEGASQDTQMLTPHKEHTACGSAGTRLARSPTLPFLSFCQFINLRRREGTRWIGATANTNVLLFMSNHFKQKMGIAVLKRRSDNQEKLVSLSENKKAEGLTVAGEKQSSKAKPMNTPNGNAIFFHERKK